MQSIRYRSTGYATVTLGLSMGTSGEIIPLLAGVLGPFWLGAAGLCAVQKTT